MRYLHTLQRLVTIRELVFLGLFLIFLLLTGFAYQNHTYSLPFADEDDNFAAARYLLKGEKLYGDIFSHHQPFSYIISVGVQAVTHIDNSNLLIARHRQFMIFWSVLWCLFLLIRFRSLIIPFITLYELTKFYLLGNSFLAESLVIYPLIYLSMLATTHGKVTLLLGELFFIGLCISICLLLLTAVWPLVVVFAILIIRKQENYDIRRYGVFLLGFFLPVLLTLGFISSISDYLYNVFYINITYYIAPTSQAVSSLQALLTPLLVFLPSSPGTQTTWIIRFMILAFFMITIYYCQQKKYFRVFLLFLIFGLANIRYVTPGLQLYTGFHLLPWYALLLALISAEALLVSKDKLGRLITKSIHVYLLVAVLLSITYASRDLFPRVHKEQEAYMNYSRQFTIGRAVQILSRGDTFFIAGAEPLIYWQANANHASRFLFYYQWMANVPQFHQEVATMFKDNPPAVLYCPCSKSEQDIYSVTQNLTNYRPILSEGKPTQLFIRKDLVAKVSEAQKKELQFYSLSID